MPRLTALQWAGEDLARPVSNDIAEQMLDWAIDTQTPIMVFVGNKGIVQIHTGEIGEVKRVGKWFNIFDPRFTLHLDTTGIASAWAVLKPTKDGYISSLELFDDEGELIVQFFGKRLGGEPELAVWKEFVASIPALETA
jgi:putative hemin transport protein